MDSINAEKKKKRKTIYSLIFFSIIKQLFTIALMYPNFFYNIFFSVLNKKQHKQ